MDDYLDNQYYTNPTVQVVGSESDWLYLHLLSYWIRYASNFRSGEPFQEESYDGRKNTVVVTVKGNEMITEETPEKAGVPSTYSVRLFSLDGMVQTSNVVGDDTKCVQKFKRVDL